METHLLFVDYEKAFDSIQWHVLFDIQTSINIPDTLLKAIVDTHTHTNTHTQTDTHTKQNINKI